MVLTLGNQCPEEIGTIPHPSVEPLLTLDEKRLYLRNGTTGYIYNYPELTLITTFSLGASTGQWTMDAYENVYWNEGYIIRKRRPNGTVIDAGISSGKGIGPNGNLAWVPQYTGHPGYLYLYGTNTSNPSSGPRIRLYAQGDSYGTPSPTDPGSDMGQVSSAYRGDIVHRVYGSVTTFTLRSDPSQVHYYYGGSFFPGITSSEIAGYSADGVIAKRPNGSGFYRVFRPQQWVTPVPTPATGPIGCEQFENPGLQQFFTAPVGFEYHAPSGHSLSTVVGATTTVYEWTKVAAEQQVVIGGPSGDWRFTAVDNSPGGVVEKGWPQGARMGEADDIWIFDGENGSEILAQHVTPLDSEYAIVFYLRQAFQGIEREGELEDDDYWGDFQYNERVTVFAALLHRRGNALYTLESDVYVGKAYNGTEREGLTSARLSNTDCAVGYTGFYNYDWDGDGYFYEASQPAVSVVRRVGDTIEVVAHTLDWNSDFTLKSDSLWTAYSGANWMASNEMNVFQIIPLTEQKFAILGVTQPSLNWAEFDTRGIVTTAPAADPNGWQAQRGIGIWIAELQGSDPDETLVWGTPCEVGTSGDYLQLFGDAIGDNRLVIQSVEQRPEFRAQSKIAGTLSLHWQGLHVRTVDIEGLVATENKHNGLYRTDLFNPMYGYTKSRPVMLTVQDGVMLWERVADLQPAKWWRPVSKGAQPIDQYGTYDTSDIESYDLGDMRTIFDSYSTSGNLNDSGGGYGWAYTASTPAAMRFLVGADGSVTSTWRPHILDASPTRSLDKDWSDGKKSSHNGTLPRTFVSGFGASKVNGHVFVTFNSGTYYNNTSPYEWAVPHDFMWKGTFLVLDDEDSPSGLAPSGYRHLGTDEEAMDWSGQHEMDLKFFPGTEYVVGCPAYWGYHEPIIDGPGLSPEYYRGFPNPDAQVFSTFWDNGIIPNTYQNPPDYGFYPRQSTTKYVWTYTGIAPDYYTYTVNTKSYPHASLLAHDAYGEVGLRGLIDPDFGIEDPWDFIEPYYDYIPPYGEPGAEYQLVSMPDFLFRPRFYWSEDPDDYEYIYAHQYVRAHIWRAVPPGVAGGHVVNERIMRTGDH